MCLGDLQHRHDLMFGRPFPIDKRVEVFSTPGYACTNISIWGKNIELGTVAVVGNLFRRQEDLEDPALWKRDSINQERQEVSRTNILQMADYTVPGQGPMFKVPQ
ncbi:metallo-beta-lactamase domain-containing protein 1-like [Saccostrea cucullata]|uniref:metallo-beta-lactamase domain-containing protein 1-like n=1 Tax=Saccostrea cuccullata TaxID=36930 RepID=UPI002ED5BBB9